MRTEKRRRVLSEKKGLFLLIMLFVVASLAEAAPKKNRGWLFPPWMKPMRTSRFIRNTPDQVEIKALGFDHHSQ